MLLTGLGIAANVGTSILSAYQQNKIQDAEEQKQARLQREQQAREAFNTNKFLQEYNENKMRADLVRDGDFSKAGGLYSSLQAQASNEGDIARQNAIDNAEKRGLASSGYIGDMLTAIDNSETQGVTNAMGKYAGSLGSQLSMLAPHYNDNTSYVQGYDTSWKKYVGNAPNLGNIGQTILTGIDTYNAKQLQDERDAEYADWRMRQTGDNIRALNTSVPSNNSYLTGGLTLGQALQQAQFMEESESVKNVNREYDNLFSNLNNIWGS